MTFYHNITKEQFNITDVDDLIAILTDGDRVMISSSGNAILTLMNEVEYNNLIKIKNERTREDQASGDQSTE